MIRFLLTLSLLATAATAGSLDIVKDFHGIEYNEIGRPVGMPMGGVGAGSIEITSAGALAELANVNNWCARIPSIPGTGLWLTYGTADRTQAFPLDKGKVCFEGNFPFAKLIFPDLPVGLTLYCWSPFVLHDIRHSAYPAAIFDATITNTGKDRARVGLVLSYGTDYGGWISKLTAASTGEIPVTVASTHTRYDGKSASGIAFSTKAQFDAEALTAKTRQIRNTLEDAYTRSFDYTPIDIRPVCNRSYLKSPFGSDPGNAPLNFADLKPGRLSIYYGVQFEIIDDSTSGGKSCIMVGGPAGTDRVTISINAKADCLFFFGNCGGWVTNDTRAEYLIRYKDGSDARITLRPNYELTDWMGGGAIYSPYRVTGNSSSGTPYQINLFAVPTDGSKEIASVDFSQTGSAAPIIFAISAGRLSSTKIADSILAIRRSDIDRMAGSFQSLLLAPNTDAGYTLAARTPFPAKEKSTRAPLLAKEGLGEVFRYQATNPEILKIELEGGALEVKGNPTIYAVEQRFDLAPGKSAEASLICSWYAPNHVSAEGRQLGHKYEDWFKGPSDVAEEIARDHDKLLRSTKQHYDIIATSTLPKSFREMAQSNFYLLPSATWLTKDGVAFTYETPVGCPLFGTMDVRYYGSFQKFAAFPELDQVVLRQFAQAQAGDGFIPHDLGATSGIADSYHVPASPAPPVMPKTDHAAYDGYWVNLPIKFCLEVARNYQWTGDRAFLREMWPHIRRAITWINAQDEDSDGLPETHYGYDGWKMYDKCGYDANQWNAMLLAVARLARDLGEPAYADELLAIRRKAVAQIDKLLWTGSYYRQSAKAGPGTKDCDWVSILQLAGTWYADILGFDDGLANDKVVSAMKTMDEKLGGLAKYGLVDCANPDGTQTGAGIADVEAVGWQYYYASHCMYRGLDEIALRVADEMWRGYTVERWRIPWCQEEFIGNPKEGDCPYWLLRDMRMGAAMVLTYAAAGLQLDIPASKATISPADWVWKDGKFTLPIILPAWLGQVTYSRTVQAETYTITNLAQPLKLASLRLRTALTGRVRLTISGKTRAASVTNGKIDTGPVTLGPEPLSVRLSGP